MLKTTLRTILVSSILATAVGIASVNAQSAMPDDMMEMTEKFMKSAQAYVQSAVGGSGNVLVSMKGDVAYLVGYVETQDVKVKAENAALKDSSVNSVKNHIQVK